MKRLSPEYAKVGLLGVAVLLWIAFCDRRGSAQISPIAKNCFELCWTGPGVTIQRECVKFDVDGDVEITLMDWQVLMEDDFCLLDGMLRCPR